jgi:5-methylthioadenosine/S-adenosylhomocysteine deaminase
MPDTVLIKNGTVVTVDSGDRILEADLLVRDGRVAQIIERGLPNKSGDDLYPNQVIDAAGCAVLPGFIQTHIHLCQTLMRGYADDLRLIDWLRMRVWPMEAAHTQESVYTSAQLGIAELMRGGTTTALTMETVRHTGEVFRAVEESGFRATVGKCMMDRGYGVPPELAEQTDSSISESLDLAAEWHGRARGRIRYAFAPRFALSCTRELLEKVGKMSKERSLMIHTHASESREEIDLICAETGFDNITYLNLLGLTGPRTVLAHCVWATDDELELLAETRTAVAHCPSSNLKLGSGVARIAEMLDRGVRVSLGADGAPCNNRLDMFTEMRSSVLLQKMRCGPDRLSARAALRMATINGAKALGLEKEIGSIEAGKRADLVILNLDRLHTIPQPNIVSTIVYAAERADVRMVMIDGRVVVENGSLTTLDEEEIRTRSRREAAELARRAGVTRSF